MNIIRHKYPYLGVTKHIYLVGIGGSGMSAIANMLLNTGYKVSGSDMQKSDITEELANMGAYIYYEHQGENLVDVDVLVYSNAINIDDNEEIRIARECNIPIINRATMLYELMRMKLGIAVAGTHGKTTTTSILGHIFNYANYDPTIMVGGKAHNFQKSNMVVGNGDIFVVEADEYAHSFLHLDPTHIVITNIEHDHIDIYQSLEEVKDYFIKFIKRVPFYGIVMVCIDDETIKDVCNTLHRKIYTYGLSEQAQFRADNIYYDKFMTSFDVIHKGKLVGHLEIKLPGEHNVKNTLAAVSCAMKLGVPFEKIKDALIEFNGVYRRFQVLSQANNQLVIDDYAHHPSEVYCTLTTAKKNWQDHRIIAIFQPHLFSRTKQMASSFSKVLKNADIVIVMPIYSSREKPIRDISGKFIVDQLKKWNHEAYYMQTDEIMLFLKENSKDNDMIIFMGAGDIWKVAHHYAKEHTKINMYEIK